MDTIARIAEEGDQLAGIESKSDALADIAAGSNISEVPEIAWVSIALPDIHYQANPVQLNVIAGKVNLTVQPGTVRGDYQPGSVDIRVTQYPSIVMSTVDVKV